MERKLSISDLTWIPVWEIDDGVSFLFIWFLIVIYLIRTRFSLLFLSWLMPLTVGYLTDFSETKTPTHILRLRLGKSHLKRNIEIQWELLTVSSSRAAHFYIKYSPYQLAASCIIHLSLNNFSYGLHLAIYSKHVGIFWTVKCSYMWQNEQNGNFMEALAVIFFLCRWHKR